MTDINGILKQFDPITLEEMESVKLMNRIDTKYAVPIWVLPNILEKAKQDYFVQQIDGKRVATYDTMYFDTDNLDMYLRHHDRQLVRQKIRIREYVESNLHFLEVKKKNNKGRTKKKRIEISGATDDTIREFISAKSRYRWDDISAKLRTKFSRITLVNKEKTERLTIDMNLVWENQMTAISKTFPELVIIELKRDGNVPSPMLRIMLSERVHPLKISKYCIGIALTTPNLKRNRFKSKIRKIEKLIQQ